MGFGKNSQSQAHGPQHVTARSRNLRSIALFYPKDDQRLKVSFKKCSEAGDCASFMRALVLQYPTTIAVGEIAAFHPKSARLWESRRASTCIRWIASRRSATRSDRRYSK
jgi:hypothetical protein